MILKCILLSAYEQCTYSYRIIIKILFDRYLIHAGPGRRTYTFFDCPMLIIFLSIFSNALTSCSFIFDIQKHPFIVLTETGLFGGNSCRLYPIELFFTVRSRRSFRVCGGSACPEGAGRSDGRSLSKGGCGTPSLPPLPR